MTVGFSDGDDYVGFDIDDMDLGLGIFINMTNPLDVWVAAKAQINSAGFISPWSLDLTVSDFILEVNTPSLVTGKHIDFATKPIVLADGFGGNLAGVEIGSGEGITLDISGAKISLSGTVDMHILDFVVISGDFAFEASYQEVNLYNANTGVSSTATVGSFMIAASDVYAFAGLNIKSDTKIGFEMTGFDFALAIMVDVTDPSQNWLSIQATMDSVAFLGLGGFSVSGTELYFELNRTANNGTVVDYASMNDGNGIDVGNITSALTLDGANSGYIAFGGVLEVSAFDLLTFNEELDFMFSVQKVQLSDGTTDDVIVIGTSITDIRVFVGFNDGTENAVGIEINDIDIGIGIYYSPFTQRVWAGMQGKASDISLVGLEDFMEASAEKVELSFNMGALDGTAIDFATTNVELPSLTGSPFVMDMQGSNGGSEAVVSLTGGYFKLVDFIYISGNVAFSIGYGAELEVQSETGLLDMVLGNSTTQTKRFGYITFAASDVDVFVGINGPYYGYGDKGNSLGLYASNIDLGFALFIEDLPGNMLNSMLEAALEGDISIDDLSPTDFAPTSFMINLALKGFLGEAGAVGFDEFMDVTFRDVNLKVNFGINFDLNTQDIKFDFINFAKSRPATDTTPAGFAVATGGDPLYIDFDANYVEASMTAEMKMSDYLYLRGSYAMRFDAGLKVKVGFGAIEPMLNSIEGLIEEQLGDVDMSSIVGGDISLGAIDMDMYALTFAGTDLYGFIGLGGPLYSDTNSDGVINHLDEKNDNAFGIAISNVDFAITFAMPTVFDELSIENAFSLYPVFVTAKGKVGEAGFVGDFGQGLLTMTVSDIEININTSFFYLHIPVLATGTPYQIAALATINVAANAASQAFGAPYIDWKASFSDFTEDTNNNGILDLTEDANGNFYLDAGEDLNENGLLDLSEDFDNDGILDTAGFRVATGSASGVIYDFDSAGFSAGIGYVGLDVLGMFQASGSMYMELETAQEVTLSNEKTAYVTTMKLAMNNVNGFVGFGQYFRDTNNNGKIDENDETNVDAVGFVLEDMDLAMAVMLEANVSLDGVGLGFYVGAKTTVAKAGLVGIDGVSMEAVDMEFGINTGIGLIDISTSHAVEELAITTAAGTLYTPALALVSNGFVLRTVDFSKSSYTQVTTEVLDDNSIITYTEEKSGYAIGSSYDLNPTVLDYSGQTFKLEGAIDINTFDLIDMHGIGSIDIDLSNGITMLGDYSVKIGNSSLAQFDANATVFMSLTMQGVAGIFSFDSESQFLGSSIAGEFVLEFNTTGQDVNYVLSEEFATIIKDSASALNDRMSVVEQTQEYSYEQDGQTITEQVTEITNLFTVSSTPVGETEAVDFYLSMGGSGQLNVLDLLNIDGEFNVLLSADGILDSSEQFAIESKIDLAGSVNMALFDEVNVSGTLGLYNGGLYGALEIGDVFGDPTKIVDTLTMDISGNMLFQFNTTNTAQSVKSLQRDADGNLTGDYIYEQLGANSLYLNGDMRIENEGAMDTYVSGAVVFDNSRRDVTLSDGSTVTVDSATFAIHDVNAFHGFEGDRLALNENFELVNEHYKFGFELESADLAFITMSEVDSDGDLTNDRNWSAVEGDIDAMGLVGDDALFIGGQNFFIDINGGAIDDTVVDFANTDYTVAGLDLSLDMDGSKGSYMGFGGDLVIEIGDFIRFEDNIEFSQKLETLVLDDGSTDSVLVASMAITDLDIFVGLGKGTDYEMGVNLSDIDFGLALLYSPLSQGSWVSMQGKASSAGIVGFESLMEISANEVSISLNTADAQGRQIDFAAKNLSIPSLTGSDFIMDTKATGGTALTVELTGARLSLMSFAFVSGDFAMTFGLGVTLDVETNVDVVSELTDGLVNNYSGQMVFDYISMGISNANLYVGLGGEYYGTENETADGHFGMYASDVDVAVSVFSQNLVGTALINPGAAVDAPMLAMAAKASMSEASIVGLDSLMDITVQDLSLSINYGQKGIVPTWINFVSSYPQTTTKDAGFRVVTGGDDVYLDFENSFTQLSVGNAEIKFANFLYLSGGMSISARNEQEISLSDGSTTTASSMLFELKDIDAYAGFNKNDANAIGFDLENMDLGLGVFLNKANPLDVWVSAKANIGSMYLNGLSGVDITANNNQLVINTKSLSGTTIDYSTPMEVSNLEDGMVFDMQGETLALGGYMSLELYGFVYLEGELAFEKSVKEVTLNTTVPTQVTVDALILAGNDITAFAGFNYSDVDNRVGFELSGVDFMFGIFNDRNEAKRSWTTMYANVGFAGMVGGTNGLTIGGKDLLLEINTASYDNFVIDYKEMGGIEISGVELDILIDGDEGNHIKFGGGLYVNFFNLFEIDTSAYFVLNLEAVKLSDGTGDNVIFLSTSITDIDIFVGFGKDTDYAVGLNISDLDIGLALAYSPLSGNIWTSMQANAQDVGIVGVESLMELSAQSIDVAVNLPAIDGTVIDYSYRPIAIESLNGGSDFIMDIDGSKSQMGSFEITGAKISMLSSVYLEGNMSITLGNDVELYAQSDGMPLGLASGFKVFDYLSFAMSDVNMYVGLNGPYYGEDEQTDAIGFYAGGIDLAFTVFVQDMVQSLILDPMTSGIIPMINVTLKADIDSMGSVGFGDFMDITIEDVAVNVNVGLMGVSTPWIDFEKSRPATDTTPAGFAVSTGGGNEIYYDFSTSKIEAYVGNASLSMMNMLYLQGSFGISIEPMITLNVASDALKPVFQSLVDLELVNEEDIASLEEATLPINMTSISFVGMDMRGFVGIGNYYVDSNNDGVIDNKDRRNEDAFGLLIDDVDIALTIATPRIEEMLDLGLMATVASALAGAPYVFTPVFVAAKADIGRAEVMTGGLRDYLSLSVEDIELDLNTSYINVSVIPLLLEPSIVTLTNGLSAALFQNSVLALPAVSTSVNSALAVIGAPYIDWASSFADYSEDINENGILDEGEDLDGNGVINTAAYLIKAGSNKGMHIDFSENTFKVAAGYMHMNLAGMIQASGSMDMTFTGSEEVVLSNGETAFVKTLSIGMQNINAFVGLGAYFQDTNNDGKYTSEDSVNSSAVGFVLEDMDLAMTVMLETSISLQELSAGIYMGVYASVGRVGITGLDDIKFEASDIELKLNYGSRLTYDLEELVAVGAVNTASLALYIAVPPIGAVAIPAAAVGAAMLIEPSLVTVDFSKSTYTDNSGNEQSGFEISTGAGNEPIVLDYEANLFSIDVNSATMSLIDVVTIDGGFEFEFNEAESKIAMFIDADLSIGYGDLNLLTSHTVADVVLNDEGLYGSLQIGNPFASNINLISNDIFTLSGGFMLQINTTNSVQSLRTLEVDSSGNLTGKIVYQDVEEKSFFIAGKLELSILDTFAMYGSGDLRITQEGFEGNATLGVDVGNFGDVEVSGSISVLNTATEGFVFAMKASSHVTLGMGVISVDADALLEINTSNKNSYAGVAAGTIFNLDLDGSLSLLSFDMTFDGNITLLDGYFELRVDEAKMVILDTFTFEVDGYITSDGEYSLHGFAGFEYDTGIDIDFELAGVNNVKLSAGIDIYIDNSGISGSFDASFSYDAWYKTYDRVYTGTKTIDLGLLGTYKVKTYDWRWVTHTDTNTYSVDGSIDLTPYSLSLSAGATLPLVDEYVGFSETWTYGNAPVVATQAGSTLYLNTGDRSDYRNSDSYDDLVNEKYTIWQNGDFLYVESFGVTSRYANVTDIVADGGDGNDTFIIRDSVTQKLNISGGAGKDTFEIYGGAEGSIIDAGDDNDTIISTIAGATYYGGAGNDSFSGSDNIDIVYMGSGTNTINSKGGADIIHIEAGNDTVDTGAGDDVIYIESNVGSLDLTSGDGDDTVIMDSILEGSTITMANESFIYDNKYVLFGTDLEDVEFTGANGEFIMTSTDDTVWSATNLLIDIDSSIVFDESMFRLVSGDLIINTNGMSGVINTDTRNVSISNTSTTTNKDIKLIASGDLTLIGSGITTEGSVSVEVSNTNSSLLLTDATITAGDDIILITNSIDFGSNVISGKGTLTLLGGDDIDTYNLFGEESSEANIMSFVSSDLDNYSGFDNIVFGQENTTKAMNIGIIDNSIDRNFIFISDTINSIVSIDSAKDITFMTNSLAIASGVNINANRLTIDSKDELLVTGNISASSLLDIDTTKLIIDGVASTSNTANINIDAEDFALNGEILTNGIDSNININSSNLVLNTNSNIENSAANSNIMINSSTIELLSTITATNELDINIADDLVLTSSSTLGATNIKVNSQKSVELKGSLSASDTIEVVSGDTITTFDTNSYSASNLIMTSQNSLSIESTISGISDEIILKSNSGDLNIVKEFDENDNTIVTKLGAIDTSALITLDAGNINIAGNINSTANTESTSDEEITLISNYGASISGELSFVGSLNISTNEDLVLQGISLINTNENQHITLDSAKNIVLGTLSGASLGTVIVQADSNITLNAAESILMGSDSYVLSAGESSSIVMDAKNILSYGKVQSGAAYNSETGTVDWVAGNTSIDIDVEKVMVVSGIIGAVGSVDISTGVAATGLGLDIKSTGMILTSDVKNDDGSIANAAVNGDINITSKGDINIAGHIGAYVDNSNINIEGTMINIDNTIVSDNSVNISSNYSVSGIGIMINQSITSNNIYLDAASDIYVLNDLNGVNDLSIQSQSDIYILGDSDASTDLIATSLDIKGIDVNILNSTNTTTVDAKIQADELLYIFNGANVTASGETIAKAKDIRIDGIVTASGSESSMYLNSKYSTVVLGTVYADNTLVLNTGIDKDWDIDTLNVLIDETDSRFADLSKGDIVEFKYGKIATADETKLSAVSGDMTRIVVEAFDTSDQTSSDNSQVNICTDVEPLSEQDIYFGNVKFEDITTSLGFVKVPTLEWFSNVADESDGIEKELVGESYTQMNAILIPTGNYFNGVIDAQGNPQYINEDAYNLLSEVEKEAYYEVFDFAYSDYTLVTTAYGETSEVALSAEWAENDTRPYRMTFEGLGEVCVVMPTGANADIVNVSVKDLTPYSMDMTLTQNGYYNGEVFKTTFIEGVDYNSADIVDANGNSLNIAKDALFNELTATQQQAVLDTLGFIASYDFSYENYNINKLIGAELIIESTEASWANEELVTKLIQVDENTQVYITLPNGAEADMVAMIAGESSSESKVIGTYSLSADLQYEQLTSVFTNPNVAEQISYSDDGSGTWEASIIEGSEEITYSIDSVDTTIAFDVLSEYIGSTSLGNYTDTSYQETRDTAYIKVAQQLYNMIHDGTLSNEQISAIEENVFAGSYVYENWTTDSNAFIAYNPYNEYVTAMFGSSTGWDTKYAFLPGEYTDGAVADYYTNVIYNDEISSIKIVGDVSVTVYMDDNYQGFSETFTSSDSNLTDNLVPGMEWLFFNWNDQISSIKVNGDIGDGYVIVYNDANYSGYDRVLVPTTTSGVSGFKLSTLHEGLFTYASESSRTISSLDNLSTMQVMNGTITDGSAYDQSIRVSFYNSTNGWSDYYQGSVSNLANIGYGTIDQMKVEGYIGTTTENVYEDFKDYTYDWTSNSVDISQNFSTLTFSNQIKNINYDISSAVMGTYAVKEVAIDYESKESTVELPQANESGVVAVDLSILGGDAPVVLGGGEGTSISIGGDAMSLSNTVVIKNSGDGGEVAISADMSLSDGASFVVFGSGHTTNLSSNVTVTEDGEFKLDDSLKIGGDVTISTEDGDITIGNIDDNVFTISGDDISGDDTLVLTTDANVNIYTKLDIHQDDTSGTNEGLIDYVEVTASDVLFERSVHVDGDMVITANNVTFNSDLTVEGDLYITADLIDIAGDIFVSGDIFIVANEFDFDNALNGNGILEILTKASGLDIEISLSEENASAFNISASELANIGNGFSNINIGKSDTRISNVTIGAGEFATNVNIYSTDLSFESGDDISVLGDLSFDVTNGIVISNNLNITGNMSVNTTANFASQNIKANSVNISSATGVSGTFDTENITVTNSTSGSVDIALDTDSTLDIANSNGAVIIDSNSDVTINTLSATDLTISSNALSISSDISVNALTIDSSSSIDLANVTASADINITSSGDITASSLSTSANISINTDGNLTATLEANSLTISAKDVDIDTSVSSIQIDARNIDINETDDLSISAINSTDSVVVSAANITSGNITAINDIIINSTDTISQNANSTISAANINLSSTNNMTLVTLSAGQELSITSSGELNGSSIVLSAIDLTIDTDSIANALNTTVDNLSLATNSGNVTINETKDLIVTSLELSGDLDIDVSLGDLTLSSDIVTAGAITLASAKSISVSKLQASSIDLSATTNIVDTNGDDVNFVTGTLSVTTNGTFGISGDSIETEITTLSASGISSLYLNEADDIVLSGVDISDGDMLISANSIVVSSDISTTGNIMLDSRNSAITLDNDISAKNIALSATDLTINSAITSNDGTISLNSADTITMGTDASLNSGANDISIVAVNDITIDDITSNSLRVVSSDGGLVQNADSSMSVSNLLVDIAGSFGTDEVALNINANNIAILNASSVNVTSTSDITIGDLSININEISSSGAVTGTDYNGSGINTTGDLNIDAVNIKQNYGASLSATNVVLNASEVLDVQAITAQSIDLDATNTLKVKGDLTSSVGDITIDSASADVVLLGDISSANDLVLNSNSNLNQYTSLSAVNDIAIGVNGDYISESSIESTSGDITISANGDISFDEDITTNDGAITISTTNGSLNVSSLEATENITINVTSDVTVGAVSGENISITSVDGDILDANGDDVNFSATNLDITTSGSFGENGNSIETTIDTLTLNGVSSLYLNETDGIELSGLDIDSGDIFVSASNIAIDSDISTTGNVMLNAKDSTMTMNNSITADNIIIKADSLELNSSLSSTTGTIMITTDVSSVVMSSDANISTNENNVSINSASNITLGNVSASGLVLKANGELTQVENSSFSASELLVDITGDFGTSENYFNLDVEKFAMANGANVYLTSEGDLTVDKVEIIVTDISDSGVQSDLKTSQNGIATSEEGLINIDIDGDLILADMLTAASSDINISAANITANSYIVTSSGDLTINADSLTTSSDSSIGGNEITLNIDSNFVINSTIGASNNLNISVNGDITLEDTASVSATENITIDANSGSFVMSEDSSLSTSLDINISATGDIEVSSISSELANVSISSSAGSVVDITETEEINISANSLSIQVANNIGYESQDLNISTNELSMSNSGTVFIENDSDLSITDMSFNNTVSIISNGTLSIDSDIVTSSDLSLESNGNMTINSISSDSDVTLVVTDGNIVNNETQFVISSNNATISANGVTSNKTSFDVKESLILANDIEFDSDLDISTDSLTTQSVSSQNLTINSNTASLSQEVSANGNISININELSANIISANNIDIDTTTLEIEGINSTDLTINSDTVSINDKVNATGDVVINSEELSVNSISANNIDINSKTIIDTNENEVNFKADTLTVTTDSFGLSGDSMDTQISRFITNSQLDTLYINEVDSITIDTDIIVNNTLYITSGDIVLDAKITVLNGDLEISSTGSITMSEDSQIIAKGDIVINAIENIVHHDIQSQDEDIVINSDSGSIKEASQDTNIKADYITVRADQDIGSQDNLYIVEANEFLIVSLNGVSYVPPTITQEEVVETILDMMDNPTKFRDVLEVVALLEIKNNMGTDTEITKTVVESNIDFINETSRDILDLISDNSIENTIVEETVKKVATEIMESIKVEPAIIEDSIDDELFGSTQLVTTMTYESSFSITKEPLNNDDYITSIVPLFDSHVIGGDVLTEDTEDFEYEYWTEDIVF
jgi:hypothetical protein